MAAPAGREAGCYKDSWCHTHAGRLKGAWKCLGDIPQNKNKWKRMSSHTQPEKPAPRGMRQWLRVPGEGPAASRPSSRSAPGLLHTTPSSSGCDAGYPRFPSCTHFFPISLIKPEQLRRGNSETAPEPESRGGSSLVLTHTSTPPAPSLTCSLCNAHPGVFVTKNEACLQHIIF